MQDTVLFLGGHLTGLRKPIDANWKRFREPIVFVVPSTEFARLDEPLPVVAPELKLERYTWIDFGAFNVAFMILSTLNPREALGQYLRGEPVL